MSTVGRTPMDAGGLEPFIPQQLYEQIEQRLIDLVLDGRLSGTRLPSERELAVRLGVSRASVREAIGSLQIRGIVQTRPGAGSYVVDDAVALIHDQVGHSAPVADIGPFALLDAREALEPGIARAAAERATPSMRADELLEQMDDAIDLDDADARGAWNEADRFFHRELAVMTGNPVFVSLAEQVAHWMDEPLWRRLRDDLIWIPGRTSSYVSEHRLIYQEIVEGQAEAAAFQAANHVRRVRRQMRDTKR